jgi:hypothetical protein
MTDNPQSMPEPLDQATHLVKSGRLEEAQAVLVRYLSTNPASEQAWLLMSYVVKDLAQQKDCLERVLRINPGNLVARSKLAQIIRVLSGEPLIPPSSASAPEALIPMEPAPTPIDFRPTIRTGRLPEPPAHKPASIKMPPPPKPVAEPAKPKSQPKPEVSPAKSPPQPKPAAEPVRKPAPAPLSAPAQGKPPPPTPQKPKAPPPKLPEKPAAVMSAGMIQSGKPDRRDLLTRLLLILLAVVVGGILLTLGYFFVAGSPSGGNEPTATEAASPVYKITLPPAWTATNTPTVTATATGTPTETPAITETPLPETGTPAK